MKITAVLLSVREGWYRSAPNTIFPTIALLSDAAAGDAFDKVPPEIQPWMSAVRRLLHDRFCDRFDDPTAMMDSFVRHNDAVRAAITVERLLEWSPSDGWSRSASGSARRCRAGRSRSRAPPTSSGPSSAQPLPTGGHADHAGAAARLAGVAQ